MPSKSTLALFAVLLLAAACGGSKYPTERDGRKVFEDAIEGTSKLERDPGAPQYLGNGLIELVSFTKLEGIPKQSGAEYFEMEYEAVFQLKGDVWRVGSDPFNVHLNRPNPTGWVRPSVVRVVKGHRFKFKGSIVWMKTESGWKLDDMNGKPVREEEPVSE